MCASSGNLWSAFCSSCRKSTRTFSFSPAGNFVCRPVRSSEFRGRWILSDMRGLYCPPVGIGQEQYPAPLRLPSGWNLPRTFLSAVALRNFSGLEIRPVLLNGCPNFPSIPDARVPRTRAPRAQNLCSRQESNLHYILRKDASYPLNDESPTLLRKIPELRRTSNGVSDHGSPAEARRHFERGWQRRKRCGQCSIILAFFHTIQTSVLREGR